MLGQGQASLFDFSSVYGPGWVIIRAVQQLSRPRSRSLAWPSASDHHTAFYVHFMTSWTFPWGYWWTPSRQASFKGLETIARFPTINGAEINVWATNNFSNNMSCEEMDDFSLKDKEAVITRGAICLSDLIRSMVSQAQSTERKSVFYSLQCPLLVGLCTGFNELKVPTDCGFWHCVSGWTLALRPWVGGRSPTGATA